MDSTRTYLVCLLAIAGYFALYQAAVANSYSRRNRPLIAVVVLFMYLMLVIGVFLLYIRSGDDPLIVFGALLMFAAVALAYVIFILAKYWNEINKTVLLILLVYLAAVVYVTLTVRLGATIKNIRMVPLSRFSEALKAWDWSLVEHDMQNMIMFIPLGVLIPLLYPRRLRRFSYAFLSAVILSTAIETTQLLNQLGVCDIDDIIANTVGAMLGYWACLLCSRFVKSTISEKTQ